LLGRRIAYVGAQTLLFSASIGDNLLYGLKHRPLIDVEYDAAAAAEHMRDMSESLASGNTTDDPRADWIDYAAAGVENREELGRAAIRALGVAEMVDDIYQLGLRGTIDPANNAEAAENILKARRSLRDHLAEANIEQLVEPFDKTRYNTNATVAENLLFGTPVGDTFNIDSLAENAYVVSVLDKYDLTDDLLIMGFDVATTMVELFSDLPSDHEFFEQFGFIKADDLPDYKELIGRADRADLATLKDEERGKLMSLPFLLIPARHALGMIEEEMQARLLVARAAFAKGLPEEHAGAIEFFDRDSYNAAASLQDNILFGKLAYGQAQASTRIGALISEIIDELALRDTVVAAGFDFQVGIGGSRLSAAQRQKLAIARCVLKRPDALILSEATAPLDGATQTKITNNLLAEFEGRALIWVLHRPSLASQFDRVLVMRGGRLVEQGNYAELDQPDTHFQELIAAE
jgi:ABC-type dipeptide/oligopeptide/nickel transport system ATPase subunit